MKRHVDNRNTRIRIRSGNATIKELRGRAECFSISKYEALKQFSDKCTIEQKNIVAGALMNSKEKINDINDQLKAEMLSALVELKKIPIYKFNDRKIIKNKIDDIKAKIIVNDVNLSYIDDIVNSQKIKIDYKSDISNDDIYKICNKNMNVSYDMSLQNYLNRVIEKVEMIDKEKMFSIIKRSQVNIFNRDENSLAKIEAELKSSYTKCIDEINLISKDTEPVNIEKEVTETMNTAPLEKNNDDMEIRVA